MFKSNFLYNQLILHNVHLGHSFINTLKSSSWFIFAHRKLVSIINLYFYKVMFRAISNLVRHLISSFSPIWFIDLEPTVEPYVCFPAFDCGELSLTQNWINGLFSNTRVLFSSFKRLKNTLEFLWTNRQKHVFDTLVGKQLFSRYTWPRGIFISGVLRSRVPALESLFSGFPGMGVVDTDTPSQLSPLAVPGNDESSKSVFFNNTFLSGLILNKKFYNVLLWFQKVKVPRRKSSFFSWFYDKIKTEFYSGLYCNKSKVEDSPHFSLSGSPTTFILPVLLGLEYIQDKNSEYWKDWTSFDFNVKVSSFRKLKSFFRISLFFSVLKKHRLRKKRRRPKKIYTRRVLKKRFLSRFFFERYRVRREEIKRFIRFKPRKLRMVYRRSLFNSFTILYFLLSYKNFRKVRVNVFKSFFSNVFKWYIFRFIFGRLLKPTNIEYYNYFESNSLSNELIYNFSILTKSLQKAFRERVLKNFVRKNADRVWLMNKKWFVERKRLTWGWKLRKKIIKKKQKARCYSLFFSLSFVFGLMYLKRYADAFLWNKLSSNQGAKNSDLSKKFNLYFYPVEATAICFFFRDNRSIARFNKRKFWN